MSEEGTKTPGVLVTGSSRGIGAAVARAFAEGGARVALQCRVESDTARETLRSLPGGPHALLTADLTDARAAAPLFDGAVRALGGVDVLVNNAGIWEEHRVLTAGFEAWAEAWDRTIAANLVAPAHLMYCAARHMRERGGGRIVNVTSRGAFRGEPDGPAYAASKAGLNVTGQSLSKALGRDGILVFTVAPGWVDTDMAAPLLRGRAGEQAREDTGIGRIASAEEVARAVLFLGTDAPASMTGCIVDVNGASYLRT
jgi:NAD(P)-dependent dehydrogenase (short-subunit alcohol dehydrogenase family)